MSRLLFMMLCTSLALNSTAASAQQTQPPGSGTSSPAAATANPFMTPSTLPYGMPAFDKIKDEHYAPAFTEAMRRQTSEINAIAENTAAPTFDNTIVAMEKAGRMLHQVSAVFFNLTSANTDPAMEAISRDLAPKLAAHNDAIRLNSKLFARISAVYDQRANLALDPESRRLLDRYYTDFVRAGAKLSDADKTKLKAINAQLASLGTTFSQNVLKETNASAVIVDTKAELKGLSDSEITAAAEAAKARGLQGKYVIALMNTTGQPYETTLTNRALRKRLYDASVERNSHGGEFDNREVAIGLAKLRAEKAQLLGYPNFAAYSLEDNTAKNTGAVNKMLAEITPAAVANAKKEAADMQKLIDAKKGGFKLAAWDWAFYAEQVRKAKYSFDESQLRPYFELDNVLQNGVFYAANKLYGISFKERKDLPVYNPTVRVFEVFDADNKPLALFLYDAYARDNKRGGAWMNEYVDQSFLFGTKPVVANHLNIPKPPEGQPTLLTPDEVRTAFHEFGHALHGMFSNVRYPRFSGTSVPRDFVEYPSQVNEMWAVWPEVLQHYAKHYQTGEAMPQALVDKLAATGKFNQGFATTEYLAATLLDQRWHQISTSQIPEDALEFEANALKQSGVDYAPVPPRYRSTYFSHIFASGYSAGYYSYIWAEVLDADTVEWFKENGGLSRKNGDWFRQQLLSKGGSIDAMDAFRNFRGHDASIQPLLVRRGLTATGSK
ncbi:M3 family metallopeptidase [Undibacterium sp.]|uniref:M3 family metallopeptidase n=1 Tax=Undibacterium sp. TaxID=1914977 RepID=UPI00374DB7E2